ncbi:MAG: S8 family serine peptidase [Thermoguttaceae bacterium]|nr:S8 family serine peptidase [Thermoguttaceae bacterium]
MFRNIVNSILFLLAVCSSTVFAAALTSSDAVYIHQQACNFGGAWDKGYSGNGVLVGVIDDSAQMDHPAYYARIENDKCKFYQGGNDVTTNGSNPRSSSDNHGTAVTGCIAANSGEPVNVRGVIGTVVGSGIVAGAAYDANLITIGNDLSSYSITSAYNYIKDQGCSVINNSYGSTTGLAGFGGIPETSFDLIDPSDPTDSKMNPLPNLHAAASNGAIILFSAGNSRAGTDTASGTSNILPNQRDSNKKMTQACVDTLVVAATGSGSYYNLDLYQKYASFSCYGANVFCCAPGGAIPTSDRTGDDGYATTLLKGSADGNYMEQFGGTSAASPLAAGVVALGVEALKSNPNVAEVTPRLMKHLLVQTCTKIDLGATGEETAWTTNDAGISFSPTYGFGQVNAGALVTAAETTMDVTAQTVMPADWGWTYSSSNSTVCNVTKLNAPREIFVRGDIIWWDSGGSVTSSNEDVLLTGSIDKNDACMTTMGYTTGNSHTTNDGNMSFMGPTDTQTFYATFSADTFGGVSVQPLEEVTLTILLECNYMGDIQIELTSPSQTKSILCYADAAGNNMNLDFNDLVWTFASNAFWGEDPTGEWKVEVKDKEDHQTDEDTGVAVKGISTTFYMGQIQEAPVPEDPSVPEPGTWVLLVLGSFGLIWLKRRR